MSDSRWLWNSISLWVSEQDISRDIKRAELFVLDDTESVYHFFGTGSRKYSIKGMIIGTANRDLLDNDATGNTVRTLTTPYGNISNLRIHSIKFTNHMYAGGLIGGVSYAADSTPLYDYEIEFVTAPS